MILCFFVQILSKQQVFFLKFMMSIRMICFLTFNDVYKFSTKFSYLIHYFTQQPEGDFAIKSETGTVYQDNHATRPVIHKLRDHSSDVQPVGNLEKRYAFLKHWVAKDSFFRIYSYSAFKGYLNNRILYTRPYSTPMHLGEVKDNSRRLNGICFGDMM